MNNEIKLNLPPLSARTLMTATTVVGLVGLAVWLLFRFHQVILLLLAGIIISLALSPVVDRLKARGVSPGLAVAFIYGLMFIAGLLLVIFGAPTIAEQVANIGVQLSDAYEAIVQNLLQTPSLLLRRLAESLPQQLGQTATPPPDDVELSVSSFEQVSRYLGLGAKALYQISAIFIFAFFWTIEGDRIKRSAVILLPLKQRESTRELLVEIERRVSGYVAGQLLLSLIIGSLSLVVYLIIGLPYALVLALFVALMELIPFVGPLIGAVPALIIGLSISPLTALWTVIASIIIHQLESNVFGPRVMKHTLGMRPLVTLLALTAFGTLFGPLGALVALPLASILQLLFDRFFVDTATPSNGDRDRIGVLRYETQELVDDVRKAIRRRDEELPEGDEKSETVEDKLEAIALDLDSLLAQLREGEAPV